MMPMTDRKCRVWRANYPTPANDPSWQHGEHHISEMHDPDTGYHYDLWWVAMDRSDYCYLGTYTTFLAAADNVSDYYTNPLEVTELRRRFTRQETT